MAKQKTTQQKFPIGSWVQIVDAQGLPECHGKIGQVVGYGRGYQGDDLVIVDKQSANAAARGLTSVRGALFARPKNEADDDLVNEGYWLDTTSDGHVKIETEFEEDDLADTTGGLLKNPPKDATCACALGAMSLTPALTRPLAISAMKANDKETGEVIDIEVYDDVRSAQIGAAYEIALRPEE